MDWIKAKRLFAALSLLTGQYLCAVLGLRVSLAHWFRARLGLGFDAR